MVTLDDKLAALDSHAARRMDVREWQHLRTLARAEGDERIVAECDYRIADELTARVARRIEDRDKLIASLISKLAEAKRLGLEACETAANYITPGHNDYDPADDDRIHRIAASLEAL